MSTKKRGDSVSYGGSISDLEDNFPEKNTLSRRNSKMSQRKISNESTRSINTVKSEVFSHKSESEKWEKYKKLAKKLSKDREELRSRLDSLLDELKTNNRSHRQELEKSQQYFQEQISELIEERDNARESIENMREKIEIDKENSRRHFEDQIAKHKATMEKRFNGKDSQVVKRLEKTIEMLQDKLTKQIDERESIKTTAESFFSQKEDEYKKIISDLEVQIVEMRSALFAEQQQIQNIIKTINREKEILVSTLKREHDDETIKIVSEKNSTISELRTINDEMQNRVKKLQKDKDDFCNKIAMDNEMGKTEYERKVSEISHSTKNLVEEVKNSYESKILEINRQHKLALEAKTAEFQKSTDLLLFEKTQVIDSLTFSFQKEKAERTKVVSALQQQLEQTKKSLEQKLVQQEEKVKQSYEDSYGKKLREMESLLYTKEKEFNTLHNRDERIITELQENLNRIQEQYSTVKNDLKNSQDANSNLSAQFLTNSNRQKESLEKEIYSRDVKISDLTNSIKRMSENFQETISALEKKNSVLVEDAKERDDKIIRMRNSIDNLESLLDKQQNDVKTARETSAVCIEKANQAQHIKESFEKKCGFIQRDLQAKEEECEKLKIQIHKTTQSELAMRENRIKTTQEIDILKNTVTKLAKEKENFNETISQLKDDIKKEKVRITEETKHTIQIISEEKDKKVAELSCKISQVEDALFNMKQLKENETTKLSQMYHEKDRLKLLLESKSSEIEKMKSDFTDVQKDNAKLRGNYINMAKEITAKDQELISLKEQVKVVQMKDEQINSINLQMFSIQENYKKTIDSIQSESKKEKEELQQFREENGELNRKLSSLTQIKSILEAENLQMKNTLTKINDDHVKDTTSLHVRIGELEKSMIKEEQKVEQIKLDTLKKINELKEVPPSQLNKIEILETDNKKLKMQLEMSEKNFLKSQNDLALANATVNARMVQISQKEEDLRKESERIRAEPPKLLDPMIKQSRDEALSQLRSLKLENTKLKEELEDLKIKRNQ